jgi:uncharacterized cupredoxin-like copper-binding protein
MGDFKKTGAPWGLRTLGLVLALGLAACGGGDQQDDVSQAAPRGKVGVTVQEWAVIPSTLTADAGKVTFNITNKGKETHEFVVLRTKLGALDLPVEGKEGGVKEGGPLKVMDEVEDMAAGSSHTLAVDLSPGHYVLICNIVEKEDNGDLESHYRQGMRTDFTVR